MCVICRLKQAGVNEELLREVQATVNLSEGFRKVLNRIEEEQPGTISDEEDEALTLLFNAANHHDDAFIEPGETHEYQLSDVPDEVLDRVRELFGDDVDIQVVKLNGHNSEELRKQFVDNGADLPDNTPIDKRKLH